MNAPNPCYRNLNRRFGAFRTIWVHLGPFGCLTKLGAKRAELVQKFVPRSRVGIFRNERTQSIPVDPKLMFWCILFYLGALRTVWLRYETRSKTGRTSAKVRARSRVGIFCNECTRSTPLDPKLRFWCILFYLVALRTKGCLTKLGAKRAEQVQKFVPRSCAGIFRNERTRSTPIEP